MKHKATIKSLLFCLLAAAVPAVATAQTTVPSFPRAGEREVTIGGSGASNRHFNDSYGGLTFSYGWYATETAAWVIRQSINYSNPSMGSTTWGGATRVAYDYHLAANGPMRPFVGANFGGVYGDAVRDTWAAGLEGGVKYYVAPRTFIQGIVEYGWFFRRARAIDNTFSSGQFNYGIGLGYNF
jgi:outer membrane protein W